MRKYLVLVLALLVIWPLNLSAQTGLAVDLLGLNRSLTAGEITCAVTATPVPATALAGRRSMVVVNISGANVFFGPSTVTTANGFQLADAASLALDITDNVVLYCISAAGGKAVRYIEAR